MPEITSIDGYLHKVRFVFPKETGDRTAYLSASFNCNGHGSTYFRDEGNWLCSITLPPGRHDYKILVNQYHSFDENRRPVSENVAFEIPLENAYHNPRMRQFAAVIGGYSIVRLAVPNGSGQYTLETQKGSVIYREEVPETFGTVYEFGGNFRKYRFSGIAGTLPENGFYSMAPEEKNSFRRTLMYQIFPDRFRREAPHTEGIVPWGSLPTTTSFYGGELKGIISKLDYLKALGVSHIYLNPVNTSGSNHRYDVLDYFAIDPILGNAEDFSRLIRTAHSMGIRIIMDMVFNHTSVDHPFFRDAVARKSDSRYYHWYHFTDDNPEIFRGRYPSSEVQTTPGYETFLGFGGMPKTNLMNRETGEYFSSVAAHYVEQFDVDGFRFDVADSIPVDFFHNLFLNFRSYGKDIEKICEAWCVAPYFTDEGLFDGLMNYPLRSMIVSLVNTQADFGEFQVQYRNLCYSYGDRVMAQMMNILGSHDVNRLRNALGEDESRFRLSYAILYMMNGIPSLYYGDEAGLTGGPDPDCRRSFPWKDINSSSLEFFRGLGRIRQEYSAMEEGITLFHNYGSHFGIVKADHENTIEMMFTLSHGCRAEALGELLMAEGVTQNGDEIEMKPFSFAVFSRSRLDAAGK